MNIVGPNLLISELGLISNNCRNRDSYLRWLFLESGSTL